MAKEILSAINECEKLIKEVNRTGGLDKHRKLPTPKSNSPVKKFELARFDGKGNLLGVLATLRNHWAVYRINFQTGPRGIRSTVLYVHSPFYAIGDPMFSKTGFTGHVKPRVEQTSRMEIDAAGLKRALERKGYGLKEEHLLPESEITISHGRNAVGFITTSKLTGKNAVHTVQIVGRQHEKPLIRILFGEKAQQLLPGPRWLLPAPRTRK